jgi:hypothetical protein
MNGTNFQPPVAPDPEAELDTALRALPLRPTPPGLARAVMARVRAYPSRPRFQISWLDVALCGFGAAMVGVLLLLRALATPAALTRLQNALSVTLVSGGPQYALATLAALALAVLIAGGLLLAAVVALALSGSRR